jgi:hypothetical protein
MAYTPSGNLPAPTPSGNLPAPTPGENFPVGLTGDFRWLPATRANLATAFAVSVPPGCHKVPAPRWLIAGVILPARHQPQA